MNRAQRDRMVLEHCTGEMARQVLGKVGKRAAGSESRDYLARCKEFGILLRAHGLAVMLGYYSHDRADMRGAFAADFNEALALVMPAASAAQVRSEPLADYLLRSRQALRIADLFKRYANALIEPLPDWARAPVSEPEETPHHA